MSDEVIRLLKGEGLTDVASEDKNTYTGIYHGQQAEVTVHDNRSRPRIRYRISVKLNGREVEPTANPEPTLEDAIAVVHWPR